MKHDKMVRIGIITMDATSRKKEREKEEEEEEKEELLHILGGSGSSPTSEDLDDNHRYTMRSSLLHDHSRPLNNLLDRYYDEEEEDDDTVEESYDQEEKEEVSSSDSDDDDYYCLMSDKDDDEMDFELKKLVSLEFSLHQQIVRAESSVHHGSKQIFFVNSDENDDDDYNNDQSTTSHMNHGRSEDTLHLLPILASSSASSETSRLFSTVKAGMYDSIHHELSEETEDGDDDTINSQCTEELHDSTYLQLNTINEASVYTNKVDPPDIQEEDDDDDEGEGEGEGEGITEGIECIISDDSEDGDDNEEDDTLHSHRSLEELSHALSSMSLFAPAGNSGRSIFKPPISTSNLENPTSRQSFLPPIDPPGDDDDDVSIDAPNSDSLKDENGGRCTSTWLPDPPGEPIICSNEEKKQQLVLQPLFVQREPSSKSAVDELQQHQDIHKSSFHFPDTRNDDDTGPNPQRQFDQGSGDHLTNQRQKPVVGTFELVNHHLPTFKDGNMMIPSSSTETSDNHQQSEHELNPAMSSNSSSGSPSFFLQQSASLNMSNTINEEGKASDPSGRTDMLSYRSTSPSPSPSLRRTNTVPSFVNNPVMVGSRRCRAKPLSMRRHWNHYSTIRASRWKQQPQQKLAVVGDVKDTHEFDLLLESKQQQRQKPAVDDVKDAHEFDLLLESKQQQRQESVVNGDLKDTLEFDLLLESKQQQRQEPAAVDDVNDTLGFDILLESKQQQQQKPAVVDDVNDTLDFDILVESTDTIDFDFVLD